MTVSAPLPNIRSDNDLNLSAWLDLFRWVAALLVVFTHVNNRFFVKILTLAPDERSLEQYGFAFVSSFGRAAVMIFFVLSGFLVGGSTLKRYMRSGNFDFVDYLLARLARLWTVLLPSLLVVFVVNRIGIDLLNGASNGVYNFTGDDGTSHMAEGPLTFLCNAAFLQTAACYQFGENGALWSLFHEFWYYVAWPVCMIAIWGRVGTLARTALLLVTGSALLILGAFQFVGPSITAYFLIWLLGVVAAYREKPFIPLGPWAALGLFLACLLACRLAIPSSPVENFLSIQALGDLIMAMSFANLILTFKTAQRVPAPPFRTWHAALAGFAFSLYCTHTPILNAYGAFLVEFTGTGWNMRPKGMGLWPYAYALGAVALCVAFAFLFSLLTERHTAKVKDVFIALRRGLTRRVQVL